MKISQRLPTSNAVLNRMCDFAHHHVKQRHFWSRHRHKRGQQKAFSIGTPFASDVTVAHRTVSVGASTCLQPFEKGVSSWQQQFLPRNQNRKRPNPAPVRHFRRRQTILSSWAACVTSSTGCSIVSPATGRTCGKWAETAGDGGWT